jgi:anti-sigma factor RsiW
MMTCRECAELLLEYLEGELDADVCERIRQHLEFCPPCVTYVETYQVTIKITKQMTCAPLPADVEERLRAALQKCLEE